MTLGWWSLSPIAASRLKAVEEDGIGFHVGVGNFEGDGAVVARVGGAENGGHAAARDRRVDAVEIDLAAGLQAHRKNSSCGTLHHGSLYSIGKEAGNSKESVRQGQEIRTVKIGQAGQPILYGQPVGAAAVHADLLHRAHADHLRRGVVAAVDFDRAGDELAGKLRRRLSFARRWRRSRLRSSRRAVRRCIGPERRLAAG